MSSITSVSPQFLVDNLQDALAFYEGCLGFNIDFVYEDFYASVSRDGAAIHLKCAPKTESDRRHRSLNNHLDAYFNVTDATALHDEMAEHGASISQALTRHPWQTLDFQITDPDGYILCFSQDSESST